MNYPIQSFSSGELSPQVDARSDIAKYRSGCRTLQNMIPRIYGPAERRPGTKYIATCNGEARVIPFIYSSEIAYIVLMEANAMYFYYGGAQVNDANGRRLRVDTPYAASDLFQIQYKQSNDVMWLVHEDYAPRKLKRVSATEFILEEITFDNGPFKTRNDLEFDNGILMTPSATGSRSTDDVTDATGCTYSASTYHNASTAADYAFDDNTDAYWQASFASTTNQYVQCQWTSARTITRVRIAPYVGEPYAGDKWNYNPQHIEIRASNDGVNFVKVKIKGWSNDCKEWNDGGATLGKVTSTTHFCDMQLDNTTAYTVWRVFIYDNWGGNSFFPVLRLTEIEMLETDADYATSATLTASSDVFDSGHVGALFALTQERTNTQVSFDVKRPTSSYVTEALLVEGEFTFTTHGTWTGTIALERTIDQVTWETYRTWEAAADTNVQYTNEESEYDVYYRINLSSLEANSSPASNITSRCRAELTVNSSTQTGIGRVTAYNSSTSVDIDIIKPFSSTTPTKRWAEGSWSDYRGFPSTVTFFDGRCVYAGSTHQPQTIWLSAVDDYEDFDLCTKADASFWLTISSDTRNGIQWLASSEALIVGTTGGEWRLRSNSFDEPLTPTNFSCKMQTNYGSKSLQAMVVNDAVLFVNYVGRKIYEASYEGNKDKYLAVDLTLLAEHITESGITDIAYQRNPDPIVWCTLADGTLISMTYDVMQGASGWAGHS